MAETYTTDGVGVILMVTGSDSGTWGTNLNANGLQYIVDAICNVLSTAITGGTTDLSGSPPPAAASQARYGLLSFTGTLTSNQTVKVPNLPKIWLVKNNTSGAFTLTMQTPTVTTSAVVPQGNQWQWVVCDGNQNVTLIGGGVSVAAGKTLTVSNSITIAGVDGKIGIFNSSPTFAGTDGKSLTLNGSLSVNSNDGTINFGNAGKTLGVNNSVSISGTDATTMTFPATSDVVAGLAQAQVFTNTNSFKGQGNNVVGSGVFALRVGCVGGAGGEGGISIRPASDVNPTYLMVFYNNASGVIGSVVDNNGGSVVYNTTSDLRVKYDFAESSRGLDDLMRVKVREFRSRQDHSGQLVNGLIAQELAPIYPEAVSQNGDDGEAPLGERAPWGIDYGRLTPLLIKAVQQLAKRVMQLEARAAL